MDARERDPRGNWSRRLTVIVSLWLATLIAAGLWQGYGAWLFGIGGGHGG
jgi:hypothetical protein